MFGRVLSALFSFAGWLFKSAMVKWVFYFALFYFVTEAIQLVVPLLPGASSLTSALSAQSPGVWFFMSVFKLGYGLSACVSAFATRFIIRRLPIIG